MVTEIPPVTNSQKLSEKIEEKKIEAAAVTKSDV